jgi:DNA-binding response OmpR family regulator
MNMRPTFDGNRLNKILVVDDIEDNCILMERHLTRAGYVVETVRDGMCAIERVSVAPPHLVLLDWMMPGLSGLDTLKAIREHYDENQLPVIMCTARDESDGIVSAINAGANDYVQKPINFPVLLARMVAQLGRKSALEALDAANRDLEKALAERTLDFFDANRGNASNS